MTASAQHTLSGWEVRVELDPGAEPVWLSPAEADALAAELLASAGEAERNAAADAALPLRDRILKRLSCCAWHVPGGLAKLLGEDVGVVQASLDELLRDGAVHLFRGIDGFYAAGGYR